MKVPVTQLMKLVREVVQDEMKKQLPNLVKEVLAEQYLRTVAMNELVSSQNKKKIAEKAPSKKQTRSLAAVMQLDREEQDPVPEPENPIADDHAGIYHEANPMVQTQHENKLLDRSNNPMAFIYENVKPINNNDMGAMSAPVGPGALPDVPAPEKLAAAGFDFERMRKLSRSLEQKAGESKMMQTPNMKMRELEERRKALEVPAVARPAVE